MTDRQRKFDRVELREINGFHDAWAVNEGVEAYLIRDASVSIEGSDSIGYILRINKHPDVYQYRNILKSKTEADCKQEEIIKLLCLASAKNNQRT